MQDTLIIDSLLWHLSIQKSHYQIFRYVTNIMDNSLVVVEKQCVWFEKTRTPSLEGRERKQVSEGEVQAGVTAVRSGSPPSVQRAQVLEADPQNQELSEQLDEVQEQL